MSIFNHLERAARGGGPADAVVIVLHGYGSSSERTILQADWLGEAFPDAHIYAPDGPLPHIGLMDPKSGSMSTEPSPGRFVWYHRYSEKTRQEGLAETQAKLEAYIDECAAAHGLDRSRVALIGLSQGAITLMNTVPRFSREVGASIAHCGYLFSPDSTAQRNTQVPEFKASVRTKTPSCFIHGTLDFTLPWQTALEAARMYDEVGISVDFHLLHGVKHADMEEHSQVVTAEFIRRHLYAKTPAALGAR